MDDARPLVSIVVTCYNYARYVGSAIESALAQTYGRCEVVVVNDGSTDDSLRVIQAFSGRITLIDQPNRGVVEAYNSGFYASRGSVVLFLDADDRLEPGAVERVIRAWSPTCVKVQYDLAIIDAEGTDLGRRFCHFPASYDAARVRDEFRRTGTYRWPVTVGNAYARSFVESVFPMKYHAPDGLLNTLAPLYGDVVTIRDALASYRIHQNNFWSSGGTDEERLPERIRHRQREVAALREHARKLGSPAPEGNALDHEIAFVNYRLAAWRLGLAYDEKERDSPGRLLRAGLRLSRGYPPALAAAHSLWFCALFSAPRPMARLLYAARFSRAGWNRAARKRAEAIGGVFSRGRPSMGRECS